MDYAVAPMPASQDRSISKPRRYQDVAARISCYITERGLEPGSRLPGEIDLAKICGVSRPTVREAMIALEIGGHLEIRSGSGAYVRQAARSMTLVLNSGLVPYDLLRARILIEGEIAADAALVASSGDLTQIEKILRSMPPYTDAYMEALNCDRQFHVAIAEATRNSILASIVDGFYEEMFAPTSLRTSQCAGRKAHQVEVLVDHEAIFTAIAERNPTEARTAMRRHLRHVEEHLTSEGVDPATDVSKNEYGDERKLNTDRCPGSLYSFAKS